MLQGIGATEILIILGIVILLFGAKKLPELARGSGQALRIFKSEVKSDEPGDKPEALEASADAAAETTVAEKKPEQQG